MSETVRARSIARGSTVLQVASRPSGWRRIRLFGASSRAPHTRRRADLITLGVVVLAIGLVVPAARTTDGVEAALAETVRLLPSLFDPLFAFAYDALAVWAVGAFLLTVIRRHLRLALSLLVALPVGGLFTMLVNAALGADIDPSTLELGAPIVGVPVQLVVALTVTSLSSREMSRPFRTSGRRLMVAATAGAILLPVAPPFRVVVAALIAVATASAVRFALGSPISTVSARDVRDGLADLGVDAEPDARWADGVHEAVTASGERLSVLVLGRDEWDNQLAVTVWQFLWYRNSGVRFFLSPRQRVEHQAFLVLLAQSRGAPVTPIVAAGSSRTGDAFVVTALDGDCLADLDHDTVDDGLVDRCWGALDALHHAGVAHGAIDPGALVRRPDGGVVLASFERAQPLTDTPHIESDRAQLLVTTALSVGTERAVAAAMRAIGGDQVGVAALVAHLQVAALDGDLRSAANRADLSLEDLREAMATAAGIDVPELQKIWRVSWGALVRLALLTFVGYLLISQLADIGWDTISEAITSANPWLLAAALAFGQVPRVAAAGSLRTASPAPVPLGRVTRLQFAMSFINLAVPSTAARVAVSIRFFQRSGATPAGALSAGALDSFAGFVAQVSLLVGLLFLGAGTLGWGGLPADQVDRSQLFRLLLLLVLLAAVAAGVVAAVPRLRAFAVQTAGQLKEALAVVRSPGAVVRLLAFNVLAELLFSATIWIVLQAFGQDVSFVDIVIINEAVALFAGLVPVPGGVGVTEGALTAGFTAVGVPEPIAFSAALCYRMCTFYLPPIWGYVALNSLRKEGFL